MRVGWILLLTMTVIMGSCGNWTNQELSDDKESQNYWIGRIKNGSFEWSKPVIETENEVYYVSINGIEKLTKQTRMKKNIVTGDSIGNLYLYENFLYFNQDDELFCVDLNGRNKSLIWNRTKLGELENSFSGIYDFQIYKGILYIKNTAISVIQYDLNIQQTKEFVEDMSSGAFLFDKFYYTDHAQRTFSIYEKDLNLGEVKLIRGDGITYEPEYIRSDSYSKVGDMFERLIVINDQLYYSMRNPAKLFRYNPQGEDFLIADLSVPGDTMQFLYLGTDGTNLYYAPTGTLEGNIYEYTPQTNKKALLITLEDICPAYSFFIVDHMLFYYTKDKDKIQIIKLNRTGNAYPVESLE